MVALSRRPTFRPTSPTCAGWSSISTVSVSTPPPGRSTPNKHLSQPRSSSRTAQTSREADHMLNNTERRGFAIPIAILVILVLTIMVAGGFSLVSAERRSVADQKSQISAFRIAEQGLEIFLIRRDSLLTAQMGAGGYSHVPLAKDSVRITLTGGYADVSLTRLRPPKGSQSGLYVARSRGVETAGAYAGTPQGVRTVAQYVLWEPAPMQVLAGWTALSGLQKNGLAGTIGGIDLCHDSAAIAGVDVPVNPGYTGKVVAVGDPPVDSIAPDSVAIDWNGIVNLGASTPTIRARLRRRPPRWERLSPFVTRGSTTGWSTNAHRHWPVEGWPPRFRNRRAAHRAPFACGCSFFIGSTDVFGLPPTWVERG